MCSRRALPWLIMLAVSGCGPAGQAPTAQVEGRLDDDTGSDVAGLGGPSLAERAHRVELCSLGASGALECVAEANVLNAGYVIATRGATQPMFVQALDASGLVLARALVEGHVSDGAVVTLQPMSTVSSLQAQVWLELQNGRAGQLDRVALRLAIDPATAVELKDRAAADAAEGDTDVHAIAMAARAAQDGTRRFLDSQNVAYEAWLDARSDAAIAVDEDVRQARFPVGQAREALRLRLVQVDQRFGLDSELVAYRSLRSVSAERIIARGLAADVPGSVIHGYLRSAAQLQARESVAGLLLVLQLAHAPPQVMAQAGAVDTQLLAAVEGAPDDATLVAAFATWRWAVRGVVSQGRVSDGLLVQLFPALAADPRTAALLEQVDALGNELDVALAAAARSGDSSEVTSAWNQFDDDCDRAAMTLFGASDPNEAAVVSLLIHAESSFR